MRQLSAMSPQTEPTPSRGPSRTVFVGRQLPGVADAFEPIGVSPEGPAALVAKKAAAAGDRPSPDFRKQRG